MRSVNESVNHCSQCRLTSARWNPYYDRDWDIELHKKILGIDSSTAYDIKHFFQTEIQVSTAPKILLIGCGTGRLEIPLLEGLAEKSQCMEIHVVDVNRRFLDRFMEALRRHLSGFTLHVHNVNIDEFWKSHSELKFRIATAFFVLYLLPRWYEVVSKILSSLEEGGYFLLANEIGDFAGQDLSGAHLRNQEFQLRNKFLCVREQLEKDCTRLYDLHSAATLGILEESLRRLQEAGWIGLEKRDFQWKNDAVTFAEYLEALTGRRKALAMGLYLPVKLRKIIWRQFNRQGKQEKKKIPRIEGHRIWVIRIQEKPEIVADAYLRSHFALTSQVDHRTIL